MTTSDLYVRVRSAQSAWFETTLGSPQDDSLSMVLFTCYLATALAEVRQKTTRPNPSISTRGLPLEWEYADDVDFADDGREPLDAVLSTTCIGIYVTLCQKPYPNTPIINNTSK